VIDVVALNAISRSGSPAATRFKARTLGLNTGWVSYLPFNEGVRVQPYRLRHLAE
jgi:hypothetical protein